MTNPAAGMPCPVDGTALVMSERAGIEIDYCPSCRGVWLDRGELDKIIERSAEQQAPAPAQRPTPQPSGWQDDVRRDHYHGNDYRYGKGKRKKSFLEELFD